MKHEVKINYTKKSIELSGVWFWLLVIQVIMILVLGIFSIVKDMLLFLT